MLYILSSNVTGEFYPLTNHLALETYKTETKSQLQSLHLSCFCVEVLFEKFFPGKESCYPGHKGFSRVVQPKTRAAKKKTKTTRTSFVVFHTSGEAARKNLWRRAL